LQEPKEGTTIDDLEINSKIKNIGNLYRAISDFKKSYQPRTNVVKDEKGDLFKDAHSIGGRTISLSYRIYIEIMICGRYT
jgi:hypothetical protein